MARALSLGLFLFAAWLLWSGHYTPQMIAFGAGSCLFCVLVARRMRILDAEGHPIQLVPGLLTYLPWLVWAIVKANLDVARRILDPALPISPRLVRVRSSQRTEVARALYANSITLTPGTVTVDVQGDEFLVHALTAEAAADLDTGDMDRRVTRVDGAGG